MWILCEKSKEKVVGWVFHDGEVEKGVEGMFVNEVAV